MAQICTLFCDVQKNPQKRTDFESQNLYRPPLKTRYRTCNRHVSQWFCENMNFFERARKSPDMTKLNVKRLSSMPISNEEAGHLRRTRVLWRHGCVFGILKSLTREMTSEMRFRKSETPDRTRVDRWIDPADDASPVTLWFCIIGIMKNALYK